MAQEGFLDFVNLSCLMFSSAASTSHTGGLNWVNVFRRKLQLAALHLFLWSSLILLFFKIKFLADQIGLTPEEVISKIMSNPDVAMAFQNPRVQAAIMDVCPIWFVYFLKYIFSGLGGLSIDVSSCQYMLINFVSYI